LSGGTACGVSGAGTRIPSRAALEGERKQITVLFADLKGSMEYWAVEIQRTRASCSTRSSNT
jgi:hypothetical protein